MTTNAVSEFDWMAKQAEGALFNINNFIKELVSKGINPEIIGLLKKLSEFSLKVGGEVLKFGQMILNEIWNFIKKNPMMAIGTILGGIFGFLAVSIPVIGPIIAPYTAMAGAGVGASVGSSVDSIGDLVKVFFSPFVYLYKTFVLPYLNPSKVK